MDVIEGSRTAQTRDFYLAYLNSPGWRARRTRALRAADWRCSQCGSKREVQVHHLTYERLGAERDSDLQVVCVSCHRDVHLRQDGTGSLGVYLKLARLALSADGCASFADLADEVKRLCAQYHVPSDGPKIDKAIGLICGASTFAAPKSREPYVSVMEAPSDRPLTDRQVRELFSRIEATVGWKPIIKTMPAARFVSQRDLDRRQALEMVAKEMQASIARCEALEREVEQG